MAQIICKQCGAENDSEDRFCGKCDVYLPWDDGTVVKTPEQQDDAPVSAPDHSRGAPPPRSDGAARPPQITPSTTTATLDGDTGAQIDIEVCNRSTIVDAFRVDIITPPQWLTLSPREVRVFPNESALLPAIFRIQSGAQVIAQTVDVVIRISSLRDTDQYVDARVSLTVPPAGPPVSISVQPAMVRLVDQTEGQAHLLLDNTDSNYPRTVALTGTDDQGALEFHFSPPRLEIGPGRTGQVEVRLRAPEIPEGANETRTATITATEGKNTTQARLTVNQQRSTMLPLRLRLEPSVLRIKGRHHARLRLVIDNRNGRQDRHIDLEGRDPEAVNRFWFERPTVTVPAGAVVTVPMSISAPRPAIADQVQRPFHVVAVESNRETEATGTLEQINTSSRARVLLIGGAILLAAAAALGAGWLIFGPKGNAPQPQATSQTPDGKPDNIPVPTTPPTTSPSDDVTSSSSNPLPGAVAPPPGPSALFRGFILSRPSVEVRATPELSSQVVGYLSFDTEVFIVCTAIGDPVEGPGAGGAPSVTTPVWDKVRTKADGNDLGFVPDAWVKTGTTKPQAANC